MHRKAAGRDQHDIEAHVAGGVLRMARQPEFGCGDDAALLALADRLGGIIELLARLDLDEDEGRRATMSISPTGVLNRRNRMR